MNRPFACTSEVHASATRCTSANVPVPLPGVLDHREFARVSTALGRCTACAGGAFFRRRTGGRASARGDMAGW